MTAYEKRVEREDEEDRIGAYVTNHPHYERLWVMGYRYIGGTSLLAQERKP